jgi:hypothetical protein
VRRGDHDRGARLPALRLATRGARARTAHPTHGERLYEFLHGHTRVRFELVDHGEWGIEARILHNDEHHMSHTFAPWHVVPFSTPRAAAIHWAENERRVMEGAD